MRDRLGGGEPDRMRPVDSRDEQPGPQRAGAPPRTGGMDITQRGRGIGIELPPGELIERIAELEVDAERLGDRAARAEAARRLARFAAARDAALPPLPELDALAEALRDLIADQRALEADLRACEAAGVFGSDFVALARALLPLRDRRAALRREVDRLLAPVGAD